MDAPPPSDNQTQASLKRPAEEKLTQRSMKVLRKDPPVKRKSKKTKRKYAASNASTVARNQTRFLAWQTARDIVILNDQEIPQRFKEDWKLLCVPPDVPLTVFLLRGKQRTGRFQQSCALEIIQELEKRAATSQLGHLPRPVTRAALEGAVGAEIEDVRNACIDRTDDILAWLNARSTQSTGTGQLSHSSTTGNTPTVSAGDSMRPPNTVTVTAEEVDDYDDVSVGDSMCILAQDLIDAAERMLEVGSMDNEATFRQGLDFILPTLFKSYPDKDRLKVLMEQTIRLCDPTRHDGAAPKITTATVDGLVQINWKELGEDIRSTHSMTGHWRAVLDSAYTFGILGLVIEYKVDDIRAVRNQVCYGLSTGQWQLRSLGMTNVVLYGVAAQASGLTEVWISYWKEVDHDLKLLMGRVHTYNLKIISQLMDFFAILLNLARHLERFCETLNAQQALTSFRTTKDWRQYEPSDDGEEGGGGPEPEEDADRERGAYDGAEMAEGGDMGMVDMQGPRRSSPGHVESIGSVDGSASDSETSSEEDSESDMEAQCEMVHSDDMQLDDEGVSFDFCDPGTIGRIKRWHPDYDLVTEPVV